MMEESKKGALWSDSLWSAFFPFSEV